MPIPLALAAAAIPAVTSLAGNLFNIASTNKTNQRQLDYNKQLYDKQRADALADWNMQNAYNSPSQQMQRFKEAGLNPNLIYGQMTNSPVIRSTEAKAPDFVAPRLETQGIGNSLSMYYDLKQKAATTELIQEQAKQKKLENENLVDQSPYLLETKFQQSRLVGKQVDNIMEDIDNKRLMNPLTRDKIKNDIQTSMQTRMWQNLTTPQQIETTKAIKALTEAKLEGQNIENTWRKYEFQLQNNFGVNKNIFGDIIKIALGSLLK